MSEIESYVGKTGREVATKGRRTPMEPLTAGIEMSDPDVSIRFLRWTPGTLEEQVCTAEFTVHPSEVEFVLIQLVHSLSGWVKPSDHNYPWEE